MQRSAVDYWIAVEPSFEVGDMDPIFMGLDRHVND